MKSLLLLLMPWHLLTWADFKGERIVPERMSVARSNISIKYNYTEDKGWYHFDSAEVVFNSDSSFTYTDDPYILQHEQTHLNIAQFICKRTNSNAKFKMWRNQKAIKHFEDEINHEWLQMDFEYDYQTKHSENQLKQLNWNLWIEKQLNNYK